MHCAFAGLELILKAAHNKSLQVTFDPSAAFAVAKAAVASKAPELRRYGAYPRSELRRKLTPVVTESAKL